MRSWLVIAWVVACGAPRRPPSPPPPSSSVEVVTDDTARTTFAGNQLVVPKGWSIATTDRVTALRPPDGDSRIVLVDVEAADAEAALARATSAARLARARDGTPDAEVDRNGWTARARYYFASSAAEHRVVQALVQRAGATWTVAILDFDRAERERRAAQIGLVFAKLYPKGYVPPTFAGKRAHTLDAPRLAELTALVEDARARLGIPGVAVGIVQQGRVVFAGGFGVRELGNPAPVDADTRFHIVSMTKPLTTLLLAKLVDERKLAWDTRVSELLPGFKLGGAATTAATRVRHLTCACTGIPRADLQWTFEGGVMTARDVITQLGTLEPTTKFGEMFQYSNLAVAVAGYVAGHVAFPELELGRAYDEAMRTRVFEPLGMTATTFDFASAQRGNHAVGYEHDFDGKLVPVNPDVAPNVRPIRPAGGAWSTVHDLLAVLQVELADGRLPAGDGYLSSANLRARRAPQVAVGPDVGYGMGVFVDRQRGVEILRHPGDGLGYNGQLMWIPEAGVGAVILTNSGAGATLRTAFAQRLLELLYDAEPVATSMIDKAVVTNAEARANARTTLAHPPDPKIAANLARRYRHPSLGTLTITRDAEGILLDIGEWRTRMTTFEDTDGAQFLASLSLGMGVWFTIREQPTRALILQDSQHEYAFEEARP